MPEAKVRHTKIEDLCEEKQLASVRFGIKEREKR
jgi:hypothetical protein